MEQVQGRMFPLGSGETVWADQSVTREQGTLVVRLTDDGIERDLVPGGAPGVRLVFGRSEVTPEEVKELCEILLARVDDVPAELVREGNNVVVPLVEPGFHDDISVRWSVTTALDVVHSDRQEPYFDLRVGGAPPEVLHESPSEWLTPVRVWHAVRVLASLMAWQQELEYEFAGAATARRHLLSADPEPPAACFGGLTSCLVNRPVLRLARVALSVRDGRVTGRSFEHEHDKTACVEFESEIDLTRAARRMLITRLAGVQGVVPAAWSESHGRVAVPFLEIDSGDQDSVYWNVCRLLQIGCDDEGRVWCSHDGTLAPEPFPIGLTAADARLLLRALVSVDAWLEELKRCAASAVVARRMERFARIGTPVSWTTGPGDAVSS